MDLVVDTGGTGDYTSLLSCLTAEITDLQILGESCNIYCLSSGGVNDIETGAARIIQAAWNTSAAYPVNIIVLPANRHTGNRNTGYILEQTVNWRSNLEIRASHVNIYGIACEYGATGILFDGVDLAPDEMECNCIGCFVYDNNGNAYHSKNNSPKVNYINNGCVSPVGHGLYIESSGVSNIHYNTFLKAGNDGVCLAGYSNVTMRNNYLGDSANEDIDDDNPGATVKSNNATSDTTGSVGLQNIAAAVGSGTYFTNVTAGTEDLNLTSNLSDLYGAGIDIPAITDDYKETTRSDPPCIGFMEYILSNNIPVIQNHRLNQGAR